MRFFEKPKLRTLKDKLSTLKKTTSYIADKISNIFFKNESKEDAEKLLKNASDLLISCSAPMANAQHALDTADKVIDELSSTNTQHYKTLNPYNREQRIGGNLGNASKKLTTSIKKSLQSENLREFLSNSGKAIEESQKMITEVASSAQRYMAVVNCTNINQEMIDSCGTNKEYLQKAQEVKEILDESVVRSFTSMGLTPLSNSLHVAASALEATEKPIKINSWQEIVERSNNCSKQLAKDSSELLEGNVGGLVKYFQNIINKQNSETRPGRS